MLITLLFSTKVLADDAIKYSNPLSPENVIYKPYTTTGVADKTSLPKISKPKPIGKHSAKTVDKVSADAVRQYLEAKHSPLSAHVAEILESEYWATIIAISAAESTYCIKVPNQFNCWGLTPFKGEKRAGRWATFDNFAEVMDDLNYRLPHYEDLWGGLENWVGPQRYCASACSNWLQTVITTKTTLENL